LRRRRANITKSVPKTIEEIARATGFSVTTVRLVMNGQAEKYRISRATRQTISDYVARYGYVLNHAARALKLRRSDAIGFVAPELSNPFFARLMAALETLCRQQGLVLLTASTHDQPEREARAVHTLIARAVDGVIVAPCRAPDYRTMLGRKHHTKIVAIDRAFPDGRHPSVTSGNRAGALALTRAMVERGGGPVPFLVANPALPSIADRLRGFAQACEELGIADWQRHVFQAVADSPEAARHLVDSAMSDAKRPPPAVMCSSLLVLEGALQRIKAKLGHIPSDMVIGTFDDHPMLDFLPNPVLSVRQDEAALAAQAFALLLEPREDDGTAQQAITVPCRLARRSATVPLLESVC
jgi:LacI family fructose operon transcriptional repressor